MVTCTLVQSVFRGFSWRKYTGDPEPSKQWHIVYEHCSEEAVVGEQLDLGFCRVERYRCAKHVDELPKKEGG